MGNCKDCKYWASHQDMWGKAWNACDLVEWSPREESLADTGFALYAEALDDSGLEAGLKTGPMFGCVRFKANKP